MICTECGYDDGQDQWHPKCCNCLRPLIPLPNPAQCTTQKSKGLAVLAEWYQNNVYHNHWNHYVRPLGILQLIKVKDGIGDFKLGTSVFARPCPPSPEHGFVESRVISDTKGLKALVEETAAVNPDSEVMLTPMFKEVHWNAIWTPKLLTVGPGNDGATAGKGTVAVPLVGKMGLLDASTLKKALIDPEEKDPYIEAICVQEQGDHRIKLTQLRAGPKLEDSVSLDYIPQEMVVSEVVKTAGQDLLEWAKVVRGLRDKPGVVVYHPGGALTDHYSVHCRENKVPILISFEPVVGLVLEPQPMPPLDPEALIRGLAVGDKLKMGEEELGRAYTALSLLALHNSAALRGPHSFWIGVGVAAILKLGSTAMGGESRHAHNCWKGYREKGYLYPYYGAKSLSYHRARLSRLTQLLHYGFGDPDQRKGYGGRKWALCGAALAPVFNAVRRLVLEPTEESASQLLLAFNVATNQNHNGGWWLNKFIDAAAYDEVPKGNLGYSVMACGAILDAHQNAVVDVARFKAKVASWPETSIRYLKWRKAEMVLGDGGIYLDLKAATIPKRVEGDQYRASSPDILKIKIPSTPSLMKKLVEAVGRVEIVPGEVRLVIDPETPPISLFKEKTLAAESRDPHRARE